MKEKGNFIVKCRPKKVSYMCPCCFCYNNVSRKNPDGFKYDIEDFKKDFNINEGTEIKNVVMDPWIDIYCKCSNCGEHVTLIEIDDGMSTIIQKLNEKGYNTLHCCEGHITNENNYDIAYVIFEVSQNADDIFFQNRIYNSFPSESWTINRRVKNIHSEVSIYMRSSYAYKEENRIVALNRLLNFVSSLPEV